MKGKHKNKNLCPNKSSFNNEGLNLHGTTKGPDVQFALVPNPVKKTGQDTEGWNQLAEQLNQ